MNALQSREKKICTQIFTANRLFNPFHTTGLFIERYQWHEIGYVMSVNQHIVTKIILVCIFFSC